MPNKIASTSSGNDRYFRRDFATGTEVDRYGNKVVKDIAGNHKLVAQEDWEEGQAPDFSYQKKYNLDSSVDGDGNYQVNLSVLDDAFIETLIENSKGLLDNKMFRVSQSLPNGDLSLNSEEVELSTQGQDNLQSLINSYNKYKNKEQTEPENITLKSIAFKNIEELNVDEKIFINDLANYLKVDVDDLIKNIKKQNISMETLCSGCHEVIDNNANFCQNCGKKKEMTCSNCNASVNENSNFCGNCGNKLK